MGSERHRPHRQHCGPARTGQHEQQGEHHAQIQRNNRASWRHGEMPAFGWSRCAGALRRTEFVAPRNDRGG